MATDPWDVFGSDSDEDQSTAPVAVSPPPVPIARPPTMVTKKKERTRYAWETLLPTVRLASGLDSADGGCLVRAEVAADADSNGSSAVELQSAPVSAVAGGGDDASGASGGVLQEAKESASAPGSVKTSAMLASRAPFSAPPMYQHPSVRFEACLPHRGGGRGFMATDDISPGTLLLVEKRFLPMPSAVECGLAGGVGQEELCLRWILELPRGRLKEVLGELRWLHPQSLDDLPEKEAGQLVSRHEETARGMLSRLGEDVAKELELDVRGVVRLFGALQSNGFASGIYLHPAMTNHSCRPNAIKWRAGQSISGSNVQHRERGRDSNGKEPALLSEIRATEFIKEGEEITISYLEPREIARDSRQSRLKDQFGFECDCSLCEGSKSSKDGNKEGGDGDTVAAAGFPQGFATALEAFVQREREGEHTDALLAPRDSVSVDREVTREGEENAGELKETDDEGNSQAAEGGEDGEDEEEEDEEEDRGGLVARNILERRLEAAESVVDLSRDKEVRWTGVLSEVLGYRRQARKRLSARHISLARADKLISKACIAILQGSTEPAEADEDCLESVRQASNELPSSFGGKKGQDRCPPLEGSFKTRVLVVFLSALISRRKTQLLYLGDGPHPEAGACLADLSQAMGMLLAQGSEGEKWISHLPGEDDDDGCDPDNGFKDTRDGPEGQDGDKKAKGLWWCGGGVSGASLFERECAKAAKMIGLLFDVPQPEK